VGDTPNDRPTTIMAYLLHEASLQDDER
jgi:hypothetical protein